MDNIKKKNKKLIFGLIEWTDFICLLAKINKGNEIIQKIIRKSTINYQIKLQLFDAELAMVVNVTIQLDDTIRIMQNNQ